MNMSSTLKIVILLFIFGFLRNNVLGARDYPTCRSGDTCIRLTNCVSYMSLIKSLKKPLTKAAVLFLRKQECGFDGLYPMVCCFSSSTRKPQGNRVTSFEDKGYSTYSQYLPNTHSINMDPEDDQYTYQPQRRPDLTPTDLSDYKPLRVGDLGEYRALKSKGADFLPDFMKISEFQHQEASTTENIKTTARLPGRKSSSNFFNGDNIKTTTAKSMQNDENDEVKKRKAEELKKKIDDINNDFIYSTMDYFFARRMHDVKEKKKSSN